MQSILSQETPCKRHHPLALLPSASPAVPAFPEAPCSVNAHVELDGLRVQVTGRGATPAEAVAHFRGTLAALQPPPAPRSLETQVAAILATGLGKAMQAQDYPLVERLAKAAAMVIAGMVQTEDAGVFLVQSRTHAGQHYRVEQGVCPCPDATHRPERACCHKLAAAMWSRLA